MNSVEVIGRMMLALGVVLAIMWLLAKWARKPLNGKSEQALSVLARQQLSRSASVAVIKVADRALVLGVTEHSVQLLGETDLGTLEFAVEQAQATSSRRKPAPAALAALAAGADHDPDSIAILESPDQAAARVSHRAAGSRRGATSQRRPTGQPGGLDGSILSPAVWKGMVQGARDLTVRR